MDTSVTRIIQELPPIRYYDEVLKAVGNEKVLKELEEAYASTTPDKILRDDTCYCVHATNKRLMLVGPFKYFVQGYLIACMQFAYKALMS